MKENVLRSVAVLIGGALGAVCRVEGNAAIMASMGGQFPLGILCINMGGSFVMGLLMACLSRIADDEDRGRLNAFLCTGFLGGFTTFSSFALDTVNLYTHGHLFFSLLNVVLNAVLCVTLAGLGWMLGSRGQEQE